MDSGITIPGPGVCVCVCAFVCVCICVCVCVCVTNSSLNSLTQHSCSLIFSLFFNITNCISAHYLIMLINPCSFDKVIS